MKKIIFIFLLFCVVGSSQAQKNPWSFGAQFNPRLAISNNATDFNTGDQKYQLYSSVFGFVASYSINSHLRIQSGVQYENWKRQSRQAPSLLFTNSVNGIITSPIGSVPFGVLITESDLLDWFASGNSTTISTSTLFEDHYIGIPIELRFVPGKGKHRGFIKTGVNPLFLLKNTTTLITYDKGEEILRDKLDFNFRNQSFGLSYHFGVGYEGHFKNMVFYFGPEISMIQQFFFLQNGLGNRRLAVGLSMGFLIQ